MRLSNLFKRHNSIEEYKFDFDGRWIIPLIINGKTIEVRNYGIAMPKGYKIGFCIDGTLVEETLTASKLFTKVAGNFDFQNADILLNCYANFMIKKYQKVIFNT